MSDWRSIAEEFALKPYESRDGKLKCIIHVEEYALYMSIQRMAEEIQRLRNEVRDWKGTNLHNITEADIKLNQVTKERDEALHAHKFRFDEWRNIESQLEVAEEEITKLRKGISDAVVSLGMLEAMTRDSVIPFNPDELIWIRRDLATLNKSSRSELGEKSMNGRIVLPSEYGDDTRLGIEGYRRVDPELAKAYEKLRDAASQVFEYPDQIFTRIEAVRQALAEIERIEKGGK